MAYPPARREDLVEDLHGERVSDPYRWLEDGDSSETMPWQQAQEDLYATARAAWPTREPFAERIASLLRTGHQGPPVWRGHRNFSTRRLPDQEHAVVLVHDADGSERVLVDPMLLDPDGRVAQVNQAMEQILGAPWNELIGRGFHDLLAVAPDPERSPFLRMLRTRQRETVDLTRGDRWLHVAIDPVRGATGGIKGALCIVSDITDRRRLEEELRRRADELAAADRRKDEFLAMLAHELRNPLAPILNALEVIRLERTDGRSVEEAL